MRESTVEKYLHEQVVKAGGDTRKVTYPGRRGAPDRLILWPGGQMEFVETKAPDGKLESWQEREHKRLRDLEFRVSVLWDKKQVDMWLFYHPSNHPSWVDRLPKC
jgi:hypothetical protein